LREDLARLLDVRVTVSHGRDVRISTWSHRDRIAVVVALALPLGVAAVLVPFRGSFANTDAALVLVVVIVAVAANGHRLAGMLAAASAAVWFDFFLTRPYERFTITHRADLETTLLLLVVGAAVTKLRCRVGASDGSR
jgi:K+-sensing histidine kinase KdpD